MFHIEEISPGMYRIDASSSDGRAVSHIGSDVSALYQQANESARALPEKPRV
jgi:hypothetical protein